MTEINKKSAPQRAVIDISRSGSWGKVAYAHRLECGHTEYRKRALTTSKIACTYCVKAQQARDTLTEIAKVTSIEYAEPVWIDEIASDIASSETDIGKLRASLASSLDISPEAVDVVSEETDAGLQISYVVIFLDAEQAIRVSGHLKGGVSSVE
jgi:hypothetical protein